ncbi:hypothetical protein JOD57_004812 [Geodermatophilus bullaregiensis]|uniref:hypothetical protein n=1 Tax=Geodermatophilus bullaregiensis TaxID=1564160 RepID=UPI00195A8673|nr:hypothetical protein [Geodermatophilus bullaregiensis]MBM7808975.1 hypothetical protein [Geodermatophilus bullaregiensis]
MSRTAHRTPTTCRAGAAAAAAVLLLTACGGGDTGAASDRPEETSAAEADAGGATSGAADFCAQAAGIDERVDTALEDLEDDDPSVSDAFRQIATELRGIDAPESITPDWEAMAAGLDRMADAFGDVDVTDLGSLEALDRAEGDLSTASARVDDYLSDECGL